MSYMRKKVPKIARNVRFDEELDRRLREFCAHTHRQESHTIRGIVRVFLADGFEAAERRLAGGAWESERNSGGSEPAER